jgi:hypothetical protein
LQGQSTIGVILIPQVGTANKVDLFLIEPPTGITATFTPNPATSGAEIRLTTDANVTPGEYPLRILASSNGLTKVVGIVLAVQNPASFVPVTSTTLPVVTTTTTTTPGGVGPFGLSITGDGRTLFVGGTVKYDIIVNPVRPLPGGVTLEVTGKPDGVFIGYSENPVTKGTATIFISTTVYVKPGTYPLLLTATNGSTTQVMPPFNLIVG